jgi:ankyrin repeat protein/mono/diheme cytochrome c family protein
MRFALVLFASLLPVVAHAQVPPPAPHAQLPPPAASTVDYEKDVKPILAQHCYSCHGLTAQQAGLRLDQRQPALRGGDYGPVIVPGKSAESKFIKRLVDGDGGLQMPPSGALSPEEIGILRAWIDQGAEFRTEIAERPVPPVDPRFAAAVLAVRSPARSAADTVVERDAALVTGVDQSGNTLLHHAAGFGALETMKRLIDAGADVNARNRFRSTPLHWAVHDSAKVAWLLSRGADVNAKQIEGRTPLFLAASMGSPQPTVTMLLEHGGDPALATTNGQTPLMAAAARANFELIGLLLDRKVDVNAKNGAGETALMFAASSGNARAVKVLLERGADARVRSKRSETALGNAATAGVEDSVRLLLQHGAEVNVQNIRGFSPLMLAANSDSVPAGVVKLLLAAGADPKFTADYDETALDLAAKRGDTPVTRLLSGATAPKASPVPPMASHQSAAPMPVAMAITKALTQLEKQSFNFIRISGCNSCHGQDLPIAAAAFARSRGIDAPREIPRLPSSMMPPPERLMDLSVVALMGPLWEMYGMGMNGEPRNAYTDAAVRLIRTAQRPEGYWSGAESRRPPMASGDFMATALAVFAITRYAPEGDTSYPRALDAASTWLARAKPQDTQDRAFHALALHWIAPRSERARTAARSLIAGQRSDGGWSQLPAMPSDAYATGLAMYALHATGKVAAADPVYRKGVDYLLRTQAADGTWHVKSRAIWLQPYFESGFPYGQDQFISAAGTAWAAMALTGAVETTRMTTVR